MVPSPIAAMHRQLRLAFLAFAAGTVLLATFSLFGQDIRKLSFPSQTLSFNTVTDDTTTTASSSDSVINTEYGDATTADIIVEGDSSNPYLNETADGKHSDTAPQSDNRPASSQRVLSVAITETGGAHDEVVAALVHSFGSQKNVQITGLYQLYSRWGMPDIMENFTLSHPPLPKNKGVDGFKTAPANETSPGTSPDVLVISTCEFDMLRMKPRLDILLQKRKTYIFCIIHHADRWHTTELKEAVTPWLKAGMLDFVALSAHTARYLETQGMNDWGLEPSRPVIYAPVFPVSLPPVLAESKSENAFALQGNYEESRRDFNTVFSHLQSLINDSAFGDISNQENVTLRLLGSGKRPKVPQSLQNRVFFDENLSYKEYYSVLSRTFTLLPAFANDEYLTIKASSTVPASLLAGTPLVATKEILTAYTYLAEDAVYLQNNNETELEVIDRILKSKSEDREHKKVIVRKQCIMIINSNVKLIEAWLEGILPRIGT